MPVNNPVGWMGTWAREHTEELHRLAGLKLSYRAIATALNEKFGTVYSKNAVLGRARRIGIVKEDAPSVHTTPRPKAPPKPRAPRIRTNILRIAPANSNSNAMRLFHAVSFEDAQLRCVEIVPRNVALVDLQPNDCRYPYGSGPILFCGHPKREGSSYCALHHDLCNEQPRIPINRFARTAA